MSVNGKTYLITFKEEENGNDYKVDTDLLLYNDTNVLLDVSRAWLVITDITDDGNHVTAKDYSGVDISYSMTWNKTQKRWYATEYEDTRTSLKAEDGTLPDKITIYNFDSSGAKVVSVQKDEMENVLCVYINGETYKIYLINKSEDVDYFIDANLRIYNQGDLSNNITLSSGFEAKLIIKDTNGNNLKDASVA